MISVETFLIEVVYCSIYGSRQQVVRELNISKGSKVQDAIIQSNICAEFEELCPYLENIPALIGRIGIFGEPVSLEWMLKEGDRVEIYLPLKKDPKEMRRERANRERRIKRQEKDLLRTEQNKAKRFIPSL